MSLEKTLYNPANVPEIKGFDCDDRIPVTEWFFNEDTKQFEPHITGYEHCQDVVDSNLGQDILSIVKRMDGSTPVEKINNAIAQNLINLSDPLEEDVDLTAMPQSAAEALRIVKQGMDKAAAFNQEIDGDFSLSEFAKGEADKAIEDYIQKRLAAALKSQEVNENGEKSE